MGYTNFWQQQTDFTPSEWSQVVTEAEYIKDWALNNSLNAIASVVIEKDHIIIDGVHPNVCENFVLYRKPPNRDRPQFCKTQLRLYDLAVRHLLSVCSAVKEDFSHHAN